MNRDRLLKYPEKTLLLPLRLFGSVGYFASIASCGKAIIRDDAIFDKRDKGVHRFDIVDTQHEMKLTVPLSKPSGKPRLTEVGISNHGDWWHTHRVTLESAYGRTPFYEFYADRLSRFFDESTPRIFSSIAELCRESNNEVAGILGLNTTILYTSQLDIMDEKESTISPASEIPSAAIVPYYQVRSERHGFVASLSILDLIFNLGPESPLLLSKMIQ